MPKPPIHIWEAETEETAESPLKKLRPAIIPWVGDKENASSSAPNEPADKAGKEFSEKSQSKIIPAKAAAAPAPAAKPAFTGARSSTGGVGQLSASLQ